MYFGIRLSSQQILQHCQSLVIKTLEESCADRLAEKLPAVPDCYLSPV